MVVISYLWLFVKILIALVVLALILFPLVWFFWKLKDWRERKKVKKFLEEQNANKEKEKGNGRSGGKPRGDDGGKPKPSGTDQEGRNRIEVRESEEIPRERWRVPVSASRFD